MNDGLRVLVEANDRRYSELRESDQRAITSALAAQKEAITKAETAIEKRFDGVNEFRSTLSDQALHLMPRTECELRLKALEEIQQKRIGMGQLWGFIIGAIGLLALIYSTVLK